MLVLGGEVGPCMSIMIADEQIEQLVLNALPDGWRKVAYVIATVGESAGNQKEKFYLRVEAAIIRLVASHVLEAAGELSNWRHSEIRRIHLEQ